MLRTHTNVIHIMPINSLSYNSQSFVITTYCSICYNADSQFLSKLCIVICNAKLYNNSFILLEYIKIRPRAVVFFFIFCTNKGKMTHLCVFNDYEVKKTAKTFLWLIIIRFIICLSLSISYSFQRFIMFLMNLRNSKCLEIYTVNIFYAFY